jgi:hypothetical protein
MPEIRSCDATVDAANTTLVTTAETTVVASPVVPMEFREQDFLILAWAQVTTGTNATSITAAIRRTALVAGALVNEKNLEGDGLAAAKSMSVFTMGMEHRTNENAVQYNLAITQNGADGNGTVKQAGIVVIAL